MMQRSTYLFPHNSHKAGEFRTGVTAVEFALVFPILLLLVFGLFEMMSLLRLGDTVSRATLAGAREAMILTATETEIEASVRQHLDRHGVRDAAIQISPARVDRSTRDVTVTVSSPASANGVLGRYVAGPIERSVTIER